MRKIKGGSSYLKNQVRKNLAKAVFCIALFFLILFILGLRLLFTMRLGVFEEAGLLVSLAPLAAFYFYLRKYRIYNAGWQAEKQVIKFLSSRLSDDYFLINDLYLPEGGGDIDHIVLASSGVFVLETKNWSGDITCRGDDWQRAGKPNFKGSPSRQVKRNAAKIKRIIDSSQAFKSQDVWVEAIVVFTNDHATLHLSNPAVLILKLPQLSSHISTRRSSRGLSIQQLEALGKEIVHQKS